MVKATDFLKNYKYSSFRDYLNENREESVILRKKSFPNYFTTKGVFLKEILDWINYNKQN